MINLILGGGGWGAKKQYIGGNCLKGGGLDSLQIYLMGGGSLAKNSGEGGS